MKKIRAAIVGCGFIANGKHLAEHGPPRRYRSRRVLRPHHREGSGCRQKFGTPDALVCVDYHDVMARTDIDVVHVCTPNSSHAEISIAALQSGKHVMCEKPMAKTAAEAKAMLDAAKATGKLLTIGYQNRFREDSLFMKNLCARRATSARSTSPRPSPPGAAACPSGASSWTRRSRAAAH